MRILTLLLVGSGVFLLDRCSKWMVMTYLQGVKMMPIVPGFDLRFAMNHGVAFSLFFETGLHSPWLLIFASLGLSMILLVMLWRTPADQTQQQLALVFILAGALGNIADRLYYGGVIDFLDVYYQQYHWPAFNIADSFICIGAFMLVLNSRGQSES